MSGLPRRRHLEDFLIHPTSPTTLIMEDYYDSPCHFRSSTLSTNAVPITPPAEVFALRPGKKTPEAAATIQDLIDEPLFWRGYTSDEEVASPIVDDNQSFHSGSYTYDSEDGVSIHEVTSPESATKDSAVEKRCNHAHTVHFVSAGKAKVVSMPKLVDDPVPQQRLVRTAPSTPTRPPVSKMNRMNIEGRAINFSRTITPRTSTERPPENNGELEGMPPTRVVRRMPNVPALQAVSRSQSPSYGNYCTKAPVVTRRDGFVGPELSSTHDYASISESDWLSQRMTPDDERLLSCSEARSRMLLPKPEVEPEPYPAQEASPVPDFPALPASSPATSNYTFQRSLSTRRPQLFNTGSYPKSEIYIDAGAPSLSRPRLLRKLSSKLSFRRFNGPSRQQSWSSNDDVDKLRAVEELPVNPISSVPVRTSSKPLPKMVARGADERAPIIEIPPCPEEYEDGDDNLLPARWPQKKLGSPMKRGFRQAGDGSEIAPTTAMHQRKKSHSRSSGGS